MRSHGPVQNEQAVRCDDCGSADIWRVCRRTGLVAFIMSCRGRKPWQCRACGKLYYLSTEPWQPAIGGGLPNRVAVR